MTVPNTTARVVHNGNGTTTQFAVPFRFLENAHVAVFLRDIAGGQALWAESTQYTLAGADEAAGGTLTVVTSPTDFTPASGEKLVILRSVPITQETDYVENDPFPAETHERALDKLTMVNQEQTERLDRTFTIPEADSFAGGFVLPIDTDRANMFQAYGPLGEPTVAAGTSANLTPVSSFVNDNVLGAGSAVVLRTTLAAQEDVIATRGAIVIGDAAGAAAALAIGAAGTVPISDGTDVAWGVPAGALPRGYMSGIETANNAIDPTNDMDFAAGVCRDDSNLADLSVTGQTRAIDAVFAEGGPGFRDATDNLTGAKTFHFFAIGGAGKADDLFASTKLAPTLPTGFTQKRRVFSRKWAGTAWQLGMQRGDTLILDATVTQSFTGSGTAATLALTEVPTGIVLDAVIRVGQNPAANAGSWGILVSALTVADEVPSANNAQTWSGSGGVAGNNSAASGDFRVRTNASAEVRHRETTNGSATFHIRTVGWVDDRGRDG